MEDSKTLERIKLLHPKLRTEALAIYKEIQTVLTGNAMCRFSYTLRTYAEQNALYNQGRTTAGKIVTNAKGGQSAHNFGLSCDIVLLVDKDHNGTFETASWETDVDFDRDGVADWMEVVNIFKRYGWEWGGSWARFPDKPHFQKLLGHSIMDLKALYDAKNFISGTTYVNI